MVGDERLDELILSLAKPEWQKTAMIIAKVCQQLEVDVVDDHGRKVEERTRYLVGHGRLESQGDLSRWRHSEVRLPGSSK